MIWPTFSNTEIRVTLYSTKWVDVKANGQDTVANGSCTVYLTKRQRTFLDGRVVNDITKAQYRAGEGQNCGSDEAPRDTTAKVGASTATTKPGPPTTKPPPTTATTKRPAATTPTTAG